MSPSQVRSAVDKRGAEMDDLSGVNHRLPNQLIRILKFC